MMHVVATAGHVDHGKSTLVRALTGTDPDRLVEERRRGLTIELGYAWCTLDSGREVAFVDVPGHERFLATMLAGVGPVPIAMFVVAADGGWMPQSEEHLTALDALKVRNALLVVTRSDLTDPTQVLADARARLARSSLGEVPAVAVSAVTGAGMAELRAAVDDLTGRSLPGDPDAPVRLWLDRAFVARGSGIVVTGTLDQGSLQIGDALDAFPAGRPVQVRGLQSLQRSVSSTSAVARVAVNLRGMQRPASPRGMALLTPGRWTFASTVDVRLETVGDGELDLPESVVLHIGTGHVGARIRILSHDGSRAAGRVSLRHALPLHVGDVLLVRDPGQARGGNRILARAVVLDVSPRRLSRRGQAVRVGQELLAGGDVPDAAAVLARVGVMRRNELVAMGLVAPRPPVVGEWLVDDRRRAAAAERLVDVVRQYERDHPLEPGMPAEAARQSVGLPDRRLVEWLVVPPLRLVDGRITSRAAAPSLPAALERAVERVETALAGSPFRAPEHEELVALGLDRRGLAAAEKVGRLMRVSDGVVLLPDADRAALSVLRELPQPFTTSEARQALDTTRRVVIPLLELLDRRGHTERVDNTRRRLR
jgi:selenocysteine-specific elongation factor